MTTGETPTPPPGAPPDGDRFSWGDFFGFQFMVTPVLIRAIYLVGVVLIAIISVLIVLGTPVTVVTNGETTSSGGAGVLGAVLLGVVYFLVAQLLWRVWMELLIVIFRIYGTLRDIEERGRGM